MSLVPNPLRPRRGTEGLRRSLAAASVGAVLAATVVAVAAPAHASATRYLYVANLRGNNVSVIDPGTRAVVATVPVGANPEGVAVSPDGSQAWAVNNTSATVSVINTATNTVSSTIAVGRLPGPVAFSPDGAHAYVGHFISPGVGGVDVIDVATDTVVADVAVGNQPFGITVSADDSRVYVANFVGSSVSVIDAATNTVTATISDPAALTPAAIALSPDGAHAYTANFNSNNISVIDTATNTISAFVPGLNGPGGVAVTVDGSLLYVPNENNNTVSAVDTATDTVIATIPVGSVPIAIVIDGGTAYVTNGGGNTVSAIDIATNTVRATVPVGNTPFAIAQAPAPRLVAPVVTGISPTSGPRAGGTSVTITGTGLSGATAVAFGGTAAASFTVDSPTQITAVAPAHAAGAVDVTVTTPGGTSATGTGDQYTFIQPAPAITGVSPTSGPRAGGTTVTITGTDLDGATAVSFGGTAAASFSVDSPTQITAVSPSHAAATVDITVTTVAGTSATGSADRYTFVQPAPVITTVSPNTGPAAGGTAIGITGTDLDGATAVSIGGAPATSFTVDSPTHISAVVPAAAAAGTVDVTVTTPGGTSAHSAADQYTYTRDTTSLTAVPLLLSLGGAGLNITLHPQATLTDTTTGQPLAGQTITFTVADHTVCSATTDTHGVAACAGLCPVVTILLAGHYTATYAGSPTEAPATATAGLLSIGSLHLKAAI